MNFLYLVVFYVVVPYSSFRGFLLFDQLLSGLTLLLPQEPILSLILTSGLALRLFDKFFLIRLDFVLVKFDCITFDFKISSQFLYFTNEV